MYEWIVFLILYFLFPQDFFKFRKTSRTFCLQYISEYFPLLVGLIYYLQVCIELGGMIVPWMTPINMVARRQFSILQRKAGMRRLMFALSIDITIVSSSSLCWGSQFNFPGIVPQFHDHPPSMPPFWPPAWLFPICNVHSSIYNGGQSGIEPGVWQMSKSTLMWHFFLSSFHELVGRLFEVLKRLCTYLVDVLHVSLVTDVTTPLFFSPFCSLFEYT